MASSSTVTSVAVPTAALISQRLGPVLELGQQVAAPLREVRDARRHPLRVQGQPEHVHRRFEQPGRASRGRMTASPAAERGGVPTGRAGWPSSML